VAIFGEYAVENVQEVEKGFENVVGRICFDPFLTPLRREVQQGITRKEKKQLNKKKTATMLKSFGAFLLVVFGFLAMGKP